MPGSERGYLPPIPLDARTEDEEYALLLAARKAAAEAIVEAEDRERDAAGARRRATRLRKTYERLLMEWNGQQRLPGTE